jgi:hypothetical protein
MRIWILVKGPRCISVSSLPPYGCSVHSSEYGLNRDELYNVPTNDNMNSKYIMHANIGRRMNHAT